MYTNHLTFNTADGKTEASPNGHTPAHSVTSAPAYDPQIDTAEEARRWNERLSRLATEAADETATPNSPRVAQALLENMQRATKFQVEQWRAIDAARAARGAR